MGLDLGHRRRRLGMTPGRAVAAATAALLPGSAPPMARSTAPVNGSAAPLTGLIAVCWPRATAAESSAPRGRTRGGEEPLPSRE